MAVFTIDEKRKIMSYVLANQADERPMKNEEKWQELGGQMNRDWKEIRDAYFLWKSEEKAVISVSQNSQDDYELNETENFQQCDCKFVSNVLDNADAFYNNMIQTITACDNHPSQSNLDQFEMQNACICPPKIAADGHLYKQFELNYIDEVCKDILEKKTSEELKMKREEHEKVMEIYEKQLQYGAEIHTECMQILKAKLQGVKRQIHDIDDIDFGKNLKRFKSGPI